MRPPNHVELNQAEQAFQHFCENPFYDHPLQDAWDENFSETSTNDPVCDLIVAAIAYGIQWQKVQQQN